MCLVRFIYQKGFSNILPFPTSSRNFLSSHKLYSLLFSELSLASAGRFQVVCRERERNCVSGISSNLSGLLTPARVSFFGRASGGIFPKNSQLGCSLHVYLFQTSYQFFFPFCIPLFFPSNLFQKEISSLSFCHFKNPSPHDSQCILLWAPSSSGSFHKKCKPLFLMRLILAQFLCPVLFPWALYDALK